MNVEDAQDYSAYLERFTRLVGDMRPGQYGKFRNRLIPRMTEDQFSANVGRYLDIGQRLTDIMNNGDTMDEGLVMELRGIEAELVLEESLFLPMPRSMA